MIHRFPNYYHDFRCLAGSCPRSCCIGWEVEVDDDTAAAYEKVSGALGNELRAHLTTDAEGSLCFPLDGLRFLDSDGLCRIHRELGQEYTSLTCREHPRFTEDFGALQETSLSASCPEAARLLLADYQPLTFVEEVCADTPEEAADPWLSPLLELRDFAMELLRDSTVSIRRRMAQVLTLTLHAQELLDADQAEMLPTLCGSRPEIPEISPDSPTLFPGFLKLLLDLEILENDWAPLLHTAAHSGGTLPAHQLERMTEYFLFRWLLKTVNDGDLLGRTQLAIASVLTVERLSAHTPSPEEALYRYCREIEHCQENIDALLEAFRWEDALQPEIFLKTLLSEHL